MLCERCFKPTDEGEHGLYLCPFEPRKYAPFVKQDSIEGGLTIHHGLCNEDGSPRTYYSRTEVNLECQKRGLVPWYEVRDNDTPILRDARVKDDWQRSSEAQRAKRWRDEARQEKYLARDREAARRRA